jgi:hypothetical protein
MEESKPWDQQPGEKALWFERFVMYLQMGTKRTKMGVYNQVRASNGKTPARDLDPTWFKAAKEWKWADRAAAYDREQAITQRERYEKERDQDRADRIVLLKALRGKVSAALPGLDFTKASPNTVIYAIGLVVQELRKEYEIANQEDPSNKSVPGSLAIREVVVEHPLDSEDEEDEEGQDDSE